MTIKLMVKTHKKTKLKYLCKTESINPQKYLGSGVYWKRHLKEHGTDIDTEVIFETESKEEFKKIATQYSNQWNVVSSKEWANLKIEEGDGGDTVSKKIWITDGVVDKYLDYWLDIPEGWKKGRSTGAFKDSNKQREFSLRVDRQKLSLSLKKAWSEGRFKRDHSKCGRKGDLNPSKRPEVREKISLKMSKPVTVKNLHFLSIKKAAEYFNVKRHVINKWLKDEQFNKN